MNIYWIQWTYHGYGLNAVVVASDENNAIFELGLTDSAENVVVLPVGVALENYGRRVLAEECL